MTTKRILVSGGTGFIGQAVVKALLKKQYTVRVLSRNAQKAKALFPNPALEIVEGDVTQPAALEGVCKDMDLVIQCAQFPNHPVENRRRHFTYFEVDGLGTENLAKAAKAAHVKHFLYISGAGTDGKKSEPWFKAKWYAEQAIHGTGLPATILRPSWVYGPGDKSLNRILKMARVFHCVPLIGSGKNHVQPVFVEDLARLVVQCAATAGEADRIFEVGGPQEWTMKAMLKKALHVRRIRALVVPAPKVLVKRAALFLQFLPGPPLNPGAVDFVTMDVRIDVRPLGEAFPNLSFKTLEEGLKNY